jgi:CheY-like chemotaxis protein
VSDTESSVLVVDDEPLIRTTMSMVLAGIGYRVRSADNGLTALREIRHEMPDILLTDLNMPGMSGFELLSVVSHCFPAMHTIAMSGAFSGREMPPGVVADAFYEKGRRVETLFQIIETLPRIKLHVPQPSVPVVVNLSIAHVRNSSGKDRLNYDAE